MRTYNLKWILASLIVFILAFNTSAQTQIGDGISPKNVPVKTTADFSYSQSIYTATDINSPSGDITELSFQFDGNSTIPNSNNWVIYLANTSKIEFTDASDWIDGALLTEVFNGTVIPVGNGDMEWITIDITDFTYNGTDNIIVAINQTQANGSDGWSNNKFFTFSSSVNRTLMTAGSTEITDLSNLPDASWPTPAMFAPNIIFGGITQSCSTPLYLSADNFTSSTADLSWVNGNNCDIELVLQGETPTGTATASNIVNNPYTYTGLNASTDYDYYIKSNCETGQSSWYDYSIKSNYGTDQSSWKGPFSFTTACGISLTPYTQDFSLNPLVCWSKATGLLESTVTLNGEISTWYNSNTFANADEKSMNIGLGTTYADTKDWLISNSIDLGTNNNKQLSFNAAYTDNNGELITSDDQYRFALVISTDNGLTWSSDNTLIQWDNAGSDNILNNISNTGERFIIDLSSYTGVVQIGFYGESLANADNNYTKIYIDEFSIKDIPTCIETDYLSLNVENISMTSATLIWNTASGETAWNIKYGVLGFDVNTEGILSSETNTFLSLTSLIPGNIYDFYVQVDCGENNSAWVGPYTFATDNYGNNCSAPITATLPTDFISNSFHDIGQTTEFRGNSTETTCLGTADRGNDIFYQLIVESEMFINITIDTKSTTSVGMLLASQCPTEDNCMLNTTGSGIFGFEQVNLTAGTYYIMIDMYQQDGFIPEFDLTINEITCPNPFYIEVVHLSSTSVNLTWESSNADTWAAILVNSGADTLGLGSESIPFSNYPLTIDTLQAETSYDFYIKSNCSVSDNSQWVGPFDVTTLSVCPLPTDLSANDLTQTSVKLVWEGAFAANWDILLGNIGFDPSTLPITYNNTSNNLVIDTLHSATTYEYYVRSDCGENDIDVSDWVGPYRFSTLCNEIILPYSQSFEDEYISACWTIVDNDNNENSWEINTSTGSNNTLQSASVKTQGLSNDWLISPPINVISNYINVDFNIRSEIVTMFYSENYKILISKTGNNPEDFTILVENVVHSPTAWELKSINLSDYGIVPGDEIHIAINAISNGHGYYIAVDNFNIYESYTDLAIINPENTTISPCNTSVNNQINIHIQNQGTNPILIGDTILTWYNLNETIVVDTIILTEILNPGDTLIENISEMTDISMQYNTYALYLHLETGTDRIIDNDTMLVNIIYTEISVSISEGDTIYISAHEFPYTLTLEDTYETYLWYDIDENTEGSESTFTINNSGTYIIQVTDIYGCNTSDTITVDLTTGIKNINIADSFSIYPNPNNGQFIIDNDLINNNSVRVEIVSINGQVIYSEIFNNLDKQQIDIQNPKPGIYLLKIIDGSSIKQQRIVIQ